MTITEMLGQSGVLTLLGMAIVFAFLAVMIFCINITGKIIHKLGLDKDIAPAAPVNAPATKTAGFSGSPAVGAAVSAAVQEYRKQNPAAAGQKSNYIVTVNGTDYAINFSDAGNSDNPGAGNAKPEQTAAPAAEPHSDGTVILAPVAGTVIRYAVNDGTQVSPGDTIIIIESMKMELEIKATVSGAVHFLAGQGTQVASQAPLAEIK